MTIAGEAVARSGRSPARRSTAAILALSAVVFVFVRAPLVSVPFERDEGEYAYIAQRILAGEVPYRDAFDQKPPGVFYVYAMAFALLGESLEAIHLFMYAWTAATALALFGCVRLLSGGLAAAFTVLVFSWASAEPRLTGNAANTEIFMLLPMVASFYCLLRGLAAAKGTGWWLLCGALAAGACWFKQVAATNALYVATVPALAVLSPGSGFARGGLLRAYGGLGAGALLATAPVLAALAAAGAWEPFLDAVVLHNLAYAGYHSAAVGREVLWHRLGEQAPSFAAAWVLASGALLFPGIAGRRAWALLAGWLLASAAGVAVGFYFRPHYFFQALPAVAALSGTALGAAGVRLLARPRIAAAGLAALVALAVAPPIAANAALRGAGSPVAFSRAIYGSNPFPESLAIGKYIRRTSEPEDRVYVIGSEPQILFYAGRRSATRYIFFYPLTGDYPDVRARQQSVVAEVAEAEPLYVVWSNLGTSLLADENTELFLFSEAMRMLDRSYQLEFVAHPVSGRESFQFVYGVDARKLMRRIREQEADSPWIALYRRVGRH